MFHVSIASHRPGYRVRGDARNVGIRPFANCATIWGISVLRAVEGDFAQFEN